MIKPKRRFRRSLMPASKSKRGYGCKDPERLGKKERAAIINQESLYGGGYNKGRLTKGMHGNGRVMNWLLNRIGI